MKKFAFAASILAISAASASVDQISTPVYSWTGGHAGIAGGYGWGHSDQTDPGIAPPPVVIDLGSGHFSLNGGLLGGTLGYNWQKGPWVFGLEGDFSGSDIAGQSAVCGPTTVTPHPFGTKLDAPGTFRGRAGYEPGRNGTRVSESTRR